MTRLKIDLKIWELLAYSDHNKKFVSTILVGRLPKQSTKKNGMQYNHAVGSKIRSDIFHLTEKRLDLVFHIKISNPNL